jgi:hypothetical protein
MIGEIFVFAQKITIVAHVPSSKKNANFHPKTVEIIVIFHKHAYEILYFIKRGIIFRSFFSFSFASGIFLVQLLFTNHI